MKIALKRSFIYTVLLFCLFVQTAQAACLYKGKSYPTGTRLGSLTCQPDGTWK